jgi:hypothetical protein
MITVEREFVLALIILFEGFAIVDLEKPQLSHFEHSNDIEVIKKYDADFLRYGYLMFSVHYVDDNTYEIKCRGKERES